MNQSSLEVGSALLRSDGGKPDAKIRKLDEDLGSTLKMVLRQSVKGVTQMAQVFESQLVQRLKRFETDSVLELRECRTR